jgi:hypothetical protein
LVELNFARHAHGNISKKKKKSHYTGNATYHPRQICSRLPANAEAALGTLYLWTSSLETMRAGATPLFLWGRAFTTGQAAQRAPKKNTGLPLAGPGQARSLRLSPSRSYCLSTRPTSPPYPAPQLLSPPSPPPSPDPLACDLQLASVAVSAARRDSASSHPGR